MHSEKRKRLKVHNEGTSYNSGYKNGEEVLDYSDGFALNKFLSELDTGKYGSVTKECEAIHAHRVKLMNMLCSSPSASQGVKSFQPSFARSNGFNHQSQVNLMQHCDIIDLDIDTPVATRANHIPEKETRKDEVPVINLDSDDEDGYPQAGVNSACNLKNPHTPASFESQLKIQANLSDYRISNQLVLYPQGIASLNFDTPVVGERPSVQYEKVVLRVNERPPSIQYQTVVLNNGTDKEQTPIPLEKEPAPLPLQTEPIPLVKAVLKNETMKPLVSHEKKLPKKETKKPRIKVVAREATKGPGGAHTVLGTKRQKSTVGRDEKASVDLHGGVNGNTESALTSIVGMQDLQMGMQESPPQVESYNEDDGVGTPEISGLDELWQDMSLALECSKDAMESDESSIVQNEEGCDHSFVLQEDFGLVCRVCGVIQKSIDTIFDFQWKKAPRMIAYRSGSHRSKDVDDVMYSGPKFSEQNLLAADISIHPRHLKQMRSHQIEGFNFLVKNMVTDDPGGCILAHAPGSGKTFLLISFIQSFLARLPHARILVILPKGILGTWKTEFQHWQVEDIPIHDFYSSKANNRAQQLAILNSWQETRSILLLGYKQFSNIVTDDDELSLRCREKLLDVPSLLIMDEGHTPRNQETDVLQSLEKVKTPCKVVLSGTLFQNRVKEVFNIFNLVRPKFLMRPSSIDVVRRIMSRIKISGRKGGCAENSFYDSVEETLQDDDNYLRKVSIIKELRELTQDVLHYYKGDILDELPGLVDFTVHLNLSPKQKEILKDMEKYQKFKRSAMENAVFVHPLLTEIRDLATADKDNNVTDEKIENILNEMDARDGVKTKFFLKILSMAVSAGEKVLVFSRYLVPLKFLEKLVINMNGWRRGAEVFMILGDSSAEQREIAMEQFNNSPDAKVFFGSIKACGEGISLVGASRVLILDIHLNPSVTRQAIGRAFRPGQKKKVYTYRLVAADSLEEEDHNTSFKKELMSKMWFDWSEFSSQGAFKLEKVDVAGSQDTFLEDSNLGQDIKALYRR